MPRPPCAGERLKHAVRVAAGCAREYADAPHPRYPVRIAGYVTDVNADSSGRPKTFFLDGSAGSEVDAVRARPRAGHRSDTARAAPFRALAPAAYCEGGMAPHDALLEQEARAIDKVLCLRRRSRGGGQV